MPLLPWPAGVGSFFLSLALVPEVRYESTSSALVALHSKLSLPSKGPNSTFLPSAANSIVDPPLRRAHVASCSKIYCLRIPILKSGKRDVKAFHQGKSHTSSTEMKELH